MKRSKANPFAAAARRAAKTINRINDLSEAALAAVVGDEQARHWKQCQAKMEVWAKKESGKNVRKNYRKAVGA